jgi:hypothetical protein
MAWPVEMLIVLGDIADPWFVADLLRELFARLQALERDLVRLLPRQTYMPPGLIILTS